MRGYIGISMDIGGGVSSLCCCSSPFDQPVRMWHDAGRLDRDLSHCADFAFQASETSRQVSDLLDSEGRLQRTELERSHHRFPYHPPYTTPLG